MALLRKISGVLVLLHGVFASGALPPVSQVIRPPLFESAEASLEHCRQYQAATWAKRLDETDSEAAVLYRLAWLQRPGGRVSSAGAASRPDAETQIAWPWRGEIWRDETDEEKDWECAGAAPGKVPPELVGDLLRPYLAKLPQTGVELRKVLARWTFAEIEAGRKVEIPTGELGNLTSAEKCEWQALSLLQRGAEELNVDTYRRYFEGCPTTGPTPAWATLSIAAGDRVLPSLEDAEAFTFYRRALGALPGEARRGLWVRLAASALLARTADDLALEAANQVLSAPADDVDGADENPVYRATIQNLVCERLAEIDPTQASALLKNLFQKNWLAQGAAWIRGCDDAAPLVRTWLEKIPTSQWRVRAELLAYLLDNSLRTGGRARAIEYAAALGRLSREHQATISFQFWKALGDAPVPTEVFAAYRRHGRWSEIDAARQSRRQAKAGRTVPPLVRSADRRESNTPLKIPTAVTPPPWSWPLPWTEDFMSAFKRHVRQDSHT